jgi:hypothetical protein
MVYVQFYELRTQKWDKEKMEFVQCEPFESDCLGSNGICILDGRLNLERLRGHAIDQAFKIRNVKKVDGFKIIRAKSLRSTGTVLHEEQYSNRDCKPIPTSW